MKIEGYIEREGLKQRIPKADEGWLSSHIPPESKEIVEVFSNEDASQVVIINRSRREFKIIHEWPERHQTRWFRSDDNHISDALVFW